MSKFKVNNIVLDECACIYRVLSVGRKYYTCQVLSDPDFRFKIEIKILDKRAINLKMENIMKREQKNLREAHEIHDINHYGIYRRGLTSEEIKTYLKIRARVESKVKRSAKTLFNKFNKIAGVNTMALEIPEGQKPITLMYRHDVLRFADKLFLGIDTYFD